MLSGRGVGLVLACAALLCAAACESRLTLGAGCVRTSECQEPTVCAGARCRAECEGDRDCTLGTCEEFASGGVCVPPLEALPCAYTTDCAPGQACIAGTCRAECAGDGDCALGTCVAGSCSEPIRTPPAQDGGVEPLACVYNGDCPAPLVCIDGICRTECFIDRDCMSGAGARCVVGVCYAASVPACDGGAGGTSCSLCGARRVDLLTDPEHCGSCGNACATNEVCLAGTCGAGGVCPDGGAGCCPVGWDLCPAFGGCRDLGNDDQHCGACGNVCSSGECASGTCAMPGERCSNAIDIDLSTPSVRLFVDVVAHDSGSCTTDADAFFRFTLTRRELVVALAPWSTIASVAQIGIIAGGCGNAPAGCADEACGHIAAVLDPGTYHLVLDDGYPGQRALDFFHMPIDGDAVELGPPPTTDTHRLTAGAPAVPACGAGPAAVYFAARCETAVATDVAVSTCGSAVDTTLSVRSNGGIVAECAIANTCAGGGETLDVTFPAGAGVDVVTVSGATAADVGDVRLDVTLR